MISTPTRAIAMGAWREQRNHRGGLWLIASQLGVAALLLWRLRPAPAPLPVALPVVTAPLLGLLVAFTVGLLRGREELYGKSVIRTVHLSPAPGGSFLLGLILARLPGQFISSLLMAGVTGWLLPAGSLWWRVPLLWVLTLLSSLAGHAAALLALVGWVRVHSRSLAILWGLAVTVGLTLAILLIGLLATGAPVAAIAAYLRAQVLWLTGAVAGLVGLPGLVMAVRIALRAGRAGEWYREAYLNMQEQGDARPRSRASRWPRLLPGPAGALQARLWRELWLNWFTWVRLALMLLTLGFFILGREDIIRFVDRAPVLWIMGIGLMAAVGAFGELPAVIGSSDGPNIGLSMVAGLRAGQVVTAKWVAPLPLVLLSAAGTWVLGALLDRPSLVPGLAAGCIGLGFGVIAMTGSLFDLDPHAEVTEREVPAILRAVLEQIPRKPASWIGYWGGLAFVGAVAWLCVRLPEAILPVAAGAAALAHLALVAGHLRLRRMGMGG